jgi:hypothetical protein
MSATSETPTDLPVSVVQPDLWPDLFRTVTIRQPAGAASRRLSR